MSISILLFVRKQLLIPITLLYSDNYLYYSHQYSSIFINESIAISTTESTKIRFHIFIKRSYLFESNSLDQFLASFLVAERILENVSAKTTGRGVGTRGRRRISVANL